MQTFEILATTLNMRVYELFNDEKEAKLQQRKWLWASILLLLQHDDAKQRQAYRILQALLEPENDG